MRKKWFFRQANPSVWTSQIFRNLEDIKGNGLINQVFMKVEIKGFLYYQEKMVVIHI